MALYFSDLDTGKTKYVDIVGTELAHIELVPDEAVGFLAAVFRDSRAKDGDRVLTVSVRDHRNEIVYRSTLSLHGVWSDHSSQPPASPG
jgi:hypothetical protein